MAFSLLKTLFVVHTAIVLLSGSLTLARSHHHPKSPSASAYSSISTNILLGGNSTHSLACPLELSCSAKTNIDTCCTPSLGLFVFSQQWYPQLGPSDEFTMHGLWPDQCNGAMGPSDGCDSSRNYDNLGDIIQRADAQLYNDMNTYWPSYKGDAPEFWSHEWNKHGTCVSTLEPKCLGSNAPQYQDVIEYFRMALALRQQFNPYTALAKANITPGNKYERDRFANALSDAWGVPVDLHCSKGQLQEIRLWMKVRGRDQFIAVPSSSKNGGNSCGRLISYPIKDKNSKQTVVNDIHL
ncbi:ribonuclease T2-like protein [Syncephalis plumigaleata]|nr:ribonuclease T2-like protein [Syncephalis plumigaleata]